MTNRHKQALAVTLGVVAFFAAVLAVSYGPPPLTSDLFPDAAPKAQAPAKPVLDVDALAWRKVTFSVYDAARFDGRPTSSGEPYDHYSAEPPYTCASNDYPLGTWLWCLGDANGPPILCRVNDRMAARYTGKRVDLSGGAYAAMDPEYDYTDARGGLIRGEVAQLTDAQAIFLIGREKWEAIRGR